jgi:transcriptional antiterminator RfaH
MAVVPSALSWFVVQTKPRAEEHAEGMLAQRAIPTFLPRLLVRKRHGSRRWEALDPLFPGYLFCRFVPTPESIARVRWAPGVKRLLGDDDGPIPVDDDVVGYLQERSAGRGYIVAGRPLAPGDRVRFRGGPFALLEGVIDRPASRAERVRVLLVLMHVPVTVEVDVAELERV